MKVSDLLKNLKKLHPYISKMDIECMTPFLISKDSDFLEVISVLQDLSY